MPNGLFSQNPDNLRTADNHEELHCLNLSFADKEQIRSVLTKLDEKIRAADEKIAHLAQGNSSEVEQQTKVQKQKSALVKERQALSFYERSLKPQNNYGTCSLELSPEPSSTPKGKI